MKDLSPKELAELKPYVFAQYLGQKYRVNSVLDGSPLNPDVTGITISAIKAGGQKGAYLQVKPLSSITDKHAESIRLLLTTENNEAGFDCTAKTIRESIVENGVYGACLFDFYGNIVFINDFLRQNSYVTPVNYKGVLYSVETLVQLGIYAKMD